jgi:hypothetical protein
VKRLALCVLAFAMLAGPAEAYVAISSGATAHMSCSAGICSPTAKNAVLNVSDLEAMLAGGDVTVETANGAETIAIVAPLTWASASRLTLSSAHSVSFKAQVVVEGTGALSLATDGKQPGGDVLFDPGGSVTFWDLSSSLVIDGTAYTLLNDIATLAQDAHAAAAGSYALAADYDATPDGTYDAAPVGTLLLGRFEGLGHTISNLTVTVSELKRKKHGYAGLFARTGKGSVVRDVALDNVQVSVTATGGAYFAVGALIGALDYGAVVDAEASGSVSGNANSTVGGLVGTTRSKSPILNAHTDCAVSGYGGIGGLVGYNLAPIVNSYATGPVTVTVATSGTGVAGGLVGVNAPAIPDVLAAGSIVSSHASGSVTANLGSRGAVGGLVGQNEGTISGSHATGPVTAPGAGGLVSINNGSIDRSYASGAVTGNGIGGLVLVNYGEITLSSATGPLNTIASTAQAGGLAAVNEGSIAQSFAAGAMSGPGAFSDAGGLAGMNQGSITDTYATGSAEGTGKAPAGGLIGLQNGGSVATSYSIGAVTGQKPKRTGGFIGNTNVGSISDGYWDIDTSGRNWSDGGIGLHDAQLKSALPMGFDPQIWGQSPGVNNGYPYLIANPPQ